MQRSRMKLRLASASLLAVIAACAGCWQKIEYKPHASSSATTTSAKSDQPAANDHPAENVVTVNADPANNEPTSGGATAPSETLSPQTSSVSPPKSDVDRYAVAPSQPATADGPNSSSGPSPTSAADISSQVNNTAAPPVEPAATPPTLPSGGAVAAQQPARPDADDRYAAPAASTSASPPPEASQAPIAPRTRTSPNSHRESVTTASTPTASKAFNGRHAAWILGSRLSLAALANDRQLAIKNVPIWLADAKSAANSLGTTIPDLPPPAISETASNASKEVIDYLLINGQRIGHHLTIQYGPVEASLFEVGLKSNLLLLIYRPGTPTVDSVSAALQEAAVRAKLPEKLWQPLIQAINTQAPPKEVQTAIKKMHADVEQFLVSGAPPSR